jgi:hypothetical protein
MSEEFEAVVLKEKRSKKMHQPEKKKSRSQSPKKHELKEKANKPTPK